MKAKMTAKIHDLAQKTGEFLAQKGWVLVTAESCTGGWVAQAITSIPGSSTWFDRGFVTYSNQAKEEMLGVKASTLERHGAVSEETVKEMAKGALLNSHGDVSIAITGIAGPTGGSPAKPVGTVWLGWSNKQGTRAMKQLFSGDRQSIREQAVIAALAGLIEINQ